MIKVLAFSYRYIKTETSIEFRDFNGNVILKETQELVDLFERGPYFTCHFKLALDIIAGSICQ